MQLPFFKPVCELDYAARHPEQVRGKVQCFGKCWRTAWCVKKLGYKPVEAVAKPKVKKASTLLEF